MITVIPYIQFKNFVWWYTINILLCQHTACSSCILFPFISEPQFSLLKSLALDVCVLSLWSVSLIYPRERVVVIIISNCKQTTCCIFEHMSVSLGDIFLKWNCWVSGHECFEHSWYLLLNYLLKHVQIYILIFAHC